MPNYVWRAKDNSGNPVVREIPATDAEQARAMLVAEGCTDLKLVAGEVEDAVMAGMPRTIKVLGEEVAITAEDREKHRGKPPATIWRMVRESMAQSKVSSVAKQHDDALEWTRRSLAENQGPTIYLDYAYRLLRYAKDPPAARAALEEAEKSTLVELAKPHHRRSHGILAYMEDNLPKAKTELEAALSMAEQTPHQPYHHAFVSGANAYLGCVLAKQGDLQAARRRFQRAAPYLIATHDDMLNECRALGLQ